MAVAEGTAGPQSHDASSGFRVLRVFVALGFKGCALTLNPKPLGYLGHVRAFKGAFRSEARCDEGPGAVQPCTKTLSFCLLLMDKILHYPL